ncbi:MAG: UPF0147 family protein [archaeon]
MPKKKINCEEMLTNIKQEIDFLLEDKTMPKNLRISIGGIDEKLKKNLCALEVSTIMYELEDLTNNNNVPDFCRSAIWSLISKLEHLKENIK